MKLKLFSFLFLIGFGYSFSQYIDLSPNAKVSLLTIGPGTSLNDSFGHCAFRVEDPGLGIDLIFNYGVYDFEAPNFYLKFARGKLNYIVDVSRYSDFKNHYVRQNRYIKEQTLNLAQKDKQRVFNFLANNSEPENKYYLYDFFYDNCATKMRDVLTDGVGLDIAFKSPKDFEARTFRQLIQDNLDWNSWGSMGIDIALGSVIDRKASAVEHMFLPEYVHDFFGHASLNESPARPLVLTSSDIFKNKEIETKSNFFLSPLFVIGLISIMILFVTYQDFKKDKRSKWLDLVVFLVTGLIGVFLLLLWFATDHSATAQNYNLLWAFALNVFVVAQVSRNLPKPWFVRYIKFLIIMLCLLLLQWVIGIQGFAFALIPLFIAIGLRYVYLVFYYNTLKSNI